MIKKRILLVEVNFEPKDQEEEDTLVVFIEEVLNISLPLDYDCKVYDHDRKIKLTKINNKINKNY